MPEFLPDPAERPGFQRLHDHAPWSVDALPGPGDTVVIAFASVGHDPDRAPSPEFVATALSAGGPALFVSDASRSWGQAPGLQDALLGSVAQLRARQPVRRIACIGQSMGAVLALRAASLLAVDVVLAFGPQSHLGASEPRWARWTAALPALPPPPRTVDAARTVLCHGMADDLAQAMGFAPAPGVDHILFPGLTHSALAPHLRQRGVLPGFLDAALQGDRRRLLRIAASCGGRLRQRLLAS